MLTVLERMPNKEGVRAALWKCRCDCGKEIVTMGATLRKGDRKSCGCHWKKAYVEPKNCEYCGQPTNGQKYRYCSRSCSARARNNVKPVEVNTDLNWKETVGGLYRCQYNMNVRCRDRDCANCGWNPEVAKARLQAVVEKRRVETV